MAGLIREKHGVDVVMTPSTSTGEFSVWVNGERVIKKLLPLIRPSDEKVLAAVARSLH